MEEQITKDIYFSNDEDRMPQRKKPSFKYGILLVLSGLLLGAISLIPVANSALFWIAKAVQLLSFIIAGVIHTSLLYKSNFKETGWTFSLLLSFFICAGLLLLYGLTHRFMPLMALGSGSAFLLPFIIAQAWNIFSDIPESDPEIAKTKAQEKEIRENETAERKVQEKKFRQHELEQKQAQRREQKEKEIAQRELEAKEKQERAVKEREQKEEKLRQKEIAQREREEVKLQQKESEQKEKEEKKRYEQELQERRQKEAALREQELQEQEQKEKELKQKKAEEIRRKAAEEAEAWRKEKEQRRQEEAALKQKKIQEREREDEERKQKEAGELTIKEEIKQKEIEQPTKAVPFKILPDKKRKDKIWYYTGDDAERQPVIFLNSMAIYVQLSIKNNDLKEEFFSANAPAEMKLDDYFNHFIYQKNKNRRINIELTDENQRPFGWQFYETLNGKKLRPLDPQLSLEKNKIKEASIIIARRVVDV